jgi:hypothetical protein
MTNQGRMKFIMNFVEWRGLVGFSHIIFHFPRQSRVNLNKSVFTKVAGVKCNLSDVRSRLFHRVSLSTFLEADWRVKRIKSSRGFGFCVCRWRCESGSRCNSLRGCVRLWCDVRVVTSRDRWHAAPRAQCHNITHRRRGRPFDPHRSLYLLRSNDFSTLFRSHIAFTLCHMYTLWRERCTRVFVRERNTQKEREHSL